MGRADQQVRPIRDHTDTDKRSPWLQTPAHEHITHCRSVSGLRPSARRGVVMAVSKSMLELHRVAQELEKRSYGLDRPRRVTVQMAETPWTMDPRRHAQDRPRGATLVDPAPPASQ